jgi:16S rRNA processing protein RimM
MQGPIMNYLLIGKLLKPKGLRGEIKAMFYADRLEDLKGFSRFFIQDKAAYKEIKIEKYKETESGLTVMVAGCDDRTKAEAIQAHEIFVEETEVPSIKKKNSYYIRDLTGMEVFEDGILTGTVDNVIEIANRMMLIIKFQGPKVMELAVPFDDEFVEKVDVKGRGLTLRNLSKLK